MIRLARHYSSLAFVAVLALSVSHARADSDDGIVRVKSAVPMQEAIVRIKADIAAKGIKFFSEIEQSRLAADAGIKLRPSTLLVFGNPPLGTQFITSNPNAGLDWPVRLLLTQDDNGDVWAVWTDFEWIAQASQHQGSRRAIQDGDDRSSTPSPRRSPPNDAGEPFDVVILGGGNAGIGVTGPVRRAGMSVAMIEARDLGGTCPNRGCTPKKILVAAGHALHEIERASIHHITVGKPRLDWSALIDREKEMIKDIPGKPRPRHGAAAGRGDQGRGRLCRPQHHPRRQPHAGSKAHRDCDGLEAAAAADFRARST